MVNLLIDYLPLEGKDKWGKMASRDTVNALAPLNSSQLEGLHLLHGQCSLPPPSPQTGNLLAKTVPCYKPLQISPQTVSSHTKAQVMYPSVQM
jgi:hypothetical protein